MYLHHVEVKSASVLVIYIHFHQRCKTTLLLHRTFPSFLKTTWKPGWPISTACWLWIINFYKQMWVLWLFSHAIHSYHISLTLKKIIFFFKSVSFYNSVGWGRSRSPGVAEVSDMWQRCSLCSEVWWRIPAISAALRHRYLEPFSFYWPGSQIRLGESTDLSLFLYSFWNSCYPYLQYTLSLLQLVSNAIQFLASVCERPHYKHLFEDQNTLTSICEKVIVPNMEFRSK